jgi:hypothetical protein
MLEDLRREMNITPPVKLYYLNFDNSSGPLILGVLHPKVFLPRTIGETWSVDEIRPILAHEMVHVKRRDVLLNWIQIIVQTLYFFHPLVWLANWRTRHFREESCDDIAIRSLGMDKMKYTKCIYNSLAETTQNPMWKLANIGFAERKSSIAKRIVRILDKKYEARVTFSLRSVLTLVAIGAASFMISCESIIGVDNGKADRADLVAENSLTAYRAISQKYPELIYLTSDDKILFLNETFSGAEFSEMLDDVVARSENNIICIKAERVPDMWLYRSILKRSYEAGALRIREIQ